MRAINRDVQHIEKKIERISSTLDTTKHVEYLRKKQQLEFLKEELKFILSDGR